MAIDVINGRDVVYDSTNVSQIQEELGKKLDLDQMVLAFVGSPELVEKAFRNIVAEDNTFYKKQTYGKVLNCFGEQVKEAGYNPEDPSVFIALCNYVFDTVEYKAIDAKTEEMKAVYKDVREDFIKQADSYKTIWKSSKDSYYKMLFTDYSQAVKSLDELFRMASRKKK
jgi:hypothetical protein